MVSLGVLVRSRASMVASAATRAVSPGRPRYGVGVGDRRASRSVELGAASAGASALASRNRYDASHSPSASPRTRPASSLGRQRHGDSRSCARPCGPAPRRRPASRPRRRSPTPTSSSRRGRCQRPDAGLHRPAAPVCSTSAGTRRLVGVGAPAGRVRAGSGSPTLVGGRRQPLLGDRAVSRAPASAAIVRRGRLDAPRDRRRTGGSALRQRSAGPAMADSTDLGQRWTLPLARRRTPPASGAGAQDRRSPVRGHRATSSRVSRWRPSAPH